MSGYCSCPMCDGEVGQCDAEGCSGCHYLTCRGCKTVFDLSYGEREAEIAACETIEGMQRIIKVAWNELRLKNAGNTDSSFVRNLNMLLQERAEAVSAMMLDREILRASLEDYQTRYLLLKQSCKPLDIGVSSVSN